MSIFSFLFGVKPQPIDGVAALMNDIDNAVRKACDVNVSDFIIDNILTNAIGRRRWHPNDIFAEQIYDDEPRDLRELLLRRNDRNVV
jgi:hypothetical protein